MPIQNEYTIEILKKFSSFVVSKLNEFNLNLHKLEVASDSKAMTYGDFNSEFLTKNSRIIKTLLASFENNNTQQPVYLSKEDYNFFKDFMVAFIKHHQNLRELFRKNYADDSFDFNKVFDIEIKTAIDISRRVETTGTYTPVEAEI